MPAQKWQPSRGTRRRLRSKLDPLATGWSTSNADLVVAVVDAEHLSSVLSRLHRDGYGPMARVLDASQSDIQSQLRGLGIESDIVLAVDAARTHLLAIRAAGRSSIVRDLLITCGISEAVIFQKRATTGGDVVATEPPPVEHTDMAADEVT